MKIAKALSSASALQVTRLSGFSGCEVLLMERHRQHLVRKISPDKTYNQRLSQQCALQQQAAQDLQAPFKVPRVLGQGHARGLYWFESEYIPGTDAVLHIMRSDVSEIQAFAGRLSAILGHFHATRTLGRKSIFDGLNSKLSELSGKVPERHLPSIGAIASHLRGLSHIDRYEISACHGDMTLENTLIAPNQDIYLIDFLDIPHPHYWFSMSKIFQDIECDWYQIHAPSKEIDPAAKAILRQHLHAAIEALDPHYRLVHYPLMAMNFLRILPYADRQDTRLNRQLDEKIAYCLHHMRETCK
jgi:hypothetical protein